jgi:pyruvate,water dikinase
MRETGLIARIEEFLGTAAVDPGQASSIPLYEEASAVIRKMVDETEMPLDIASAIRQHYQALCAAAGNEAVPVATRSAGPASHPGQYETYLHVRGAPEVIHNVKKVWGSTFNTRSLVARARQGLSLAYDPIGVAVLKMVPAKAAGVMFTVNPADGDDSRIYIESAWGLGESVVSGEVTPDSFLVHKVSSEILKRTISPKMVWYVADAETGGVAQHAVPEERRNASTLSDEEVLELARLGRLVEDHFGQPQDVEWAVDEGLALPESILLLQTRAAKTEVKKKSSTDRIIDLMMRGIS